jgi:hypothetical protein
MLTLALFLMAGSCGSWKVNGNWTATLTGNNTSPSFALSMRLDETNTDSVLVTHLNFTTATPCFTQGSTTASGAFTPHVTPDGVSSGTIALVIQSDASMNNTLTLNGVVDDSTATGTWTLTGPTPGCTGAGTFTMHR